QPRGLDAIFLKTMVSEITKRWPPYDDWRLYVFTCKSQKKLTQNKRPRIDLTLETPCECVMTGMLNMMMMANRILTYGG
ncbi:MAG: hypothetical protein ACKO96_22870, partial [Flammeovirgaceae bacterium]